LELSESAQRADASEFVDKIKRAEYELDRQRRTKMISGGEITGGLTEICDLENLVIVSDLHGDSNTLFRILSEIRYDRFLSRSKNKLVFLGDYVDRGSDSIGVLYSVCHLKGSYPDSVIMMRGNHEAPAELPFSPHDFPNRLANRFGNSLKGIYEDVLSLFRLMTLATVITSDVLLVHGGLPTDKATAEDFRKSIPFAQENHLNNNVLEEILWNDPVQIDTKENPNKSRRGLGRSFGPSVTRMWLQSTRTKAVIRGHEPCQGFKLNHDDLVLTLFSCLEAYYPSATAAYVMLNSAQLHSINSAKDLSLYVRFPA
jgi:hypothetical protein